MTTALVLSGGGSLGAVQVGMLRALVEAGVDFDMLVGTSVGAVNAAWMAADPSLDGVDGLARLWRGLRRDDVFPASPWHGMLAASGLRRSLITDRGLRTLLGRHLGFEQLEDAPIPVHVVAVDALTGRSAAISTGPAVDAVLASTAIPGVLPPVRIGSRWFLDGGVVDNCPVRHAVDLGASTLWVLSAGYPCASTELPTTAVGMALQGLTLLVQHGLALDVERYRHDIEVRVAPRGPLVHLPLRVPHLWCEREPNHTEGVSVETSVPTVDLAPLGRALGRHTDELVDEMIDILVDQVVELQGDEQVVGRLRASVESNVAAIRHLLEQPLDIRLVEPPTGALQWSLRLAQRGIPLSVLWRAYHLCTARVLLFFVEELTRHSESVEELGAKFAAAGTLLNHYVDHVCERVGASYESERQRWLRQQDVVRAERISDLLAGRVVDTRQVEAALSYRLAGRHLGSILWDSDPSGVADLMRLQRWATRCADRLGCREPPLIVARDQSTVWVWFTPPTAADGDTSTPAEVVADVATGPTMRAAVGDPGEGVGGFGSTHRQAAAAQSVALAAGEAAATVTPYSAVSGVSFLCQDMVRAREWVRETLGPLAVDDEVHDQLRVSVGVFLEAGGSLSAASERLGCHKNTVGHRIRRAEHALGRSVRDRRVDLELALQACRWLGAAVLHPPATP